MNREISLVQTVSQITRIAAGLIVGACFVVGCASDARSKAAAEDARSTTSRSRAPTAPRPAAINHLAFFKLKDPSQADELILECDRMLGTIPGVISYFCGRHIDTGRGERIDADYDVAFYVGFANEMNYNAYVKHANHQEMINRWQPRWQWIRIHDVRDATP